MVDIFKHYPGSKNVNGTYHKIINLIPPHEKYIEPFLGGGAILRHKLPAAVTVGNDLHTGIYEIWKNYQMPGFEIHNIDALQLLSSLGTGNRNIFVYLDPPYPMESRRCSKAIYNCELSDQYHENLLQFILTVDFNCMISTYPNKLYSKLLKGWKKYEFKSITRAGNSYEVLYMNYPTPTKLHDYRYLGRDCWERQGIKRKIERRVNTLSKLPILEQRAIILALNERL